MYAPKTSTFKAIALAAAVLAGSPALADNQSIAITGPTTVFTDTTPLVGFIDIKSFTGLANGVYSFNLGFVGFGLNLLGATFDGTNVPLTSPFPGITAGALAGTFTVSGAPVLFALAGTTSSAAPAYTGVLNISLVPEPETYAMFAAGLVAMGFLLRRRNRA